MVSILFGKSQAIVDAEAELRQREDDFMKLDQREHLDLGVHAQMDAQRLGVVLGRIRLMQTKHEQNANRNLLATLFSALALIVATKGTDIFVGVVKVLSAVL